MTHAVSLREAYFAIAEDAPKQSRVAIGGRETRLLCRHAKRVTPRNDSSWVPQSKSREPNLNRGL